MLRIDDVSEENVEDVLEICSGDRPFASVDDPILEKGREIKRKWLFDMLERYGSCAKIAYLDEKPVAQILFYPEETMPYLHNPRKDVIYLKCIFNAFPKAQRKGVGGALLKALINECHTGLDCLGGRPCRFVVTLTFPLEGEIHLITLSEFYSKYGFKKGHREMFLEVKGKYEPREIPGYRPLPEDRGSIVVAYNPDCELGYFRVTTIKDIFQGKYPNLPFEIFNSWEKPEEYKKRGGVWIRFTGGILVNAKILRNPCVFWADRKAFIRNVEEMLRKECAARE